MIKLKNLHKSFGDLHVLKGIDLQIDKGEIVAIVGPSGSGKSTVLRCMNLLEEPTEGEIIFEGKDITGSKVNIDEVRQNIGMVFQNFNLFPHMTVLDNITLAPIKIKKLSKEEANKKAEILLDRVGLLDKKDAYPAQLSGGQKQRIAIARAILKKPNILIFDDATSALDLATEAKLYKTLKENLSQVTILLVAQRVASVTGANQIAVIDNGMLSALGTNEELLKTSKLYQDIYNSQLKIEGSKL